MDKHTKYQHGDIVLVATRYGVYKARIEQGQSPGHYKCVFLESNEPVVEEGQIFTVPCNLLSPYGGVKDTEQ